MSVESPSRSSGSRRTPTTGRSSMRTASGCSSTPRPGRVGGRVQTVKTAYERLQNGYEPGDPLPEETAEPETEEAPPAPDDPMVEFLNTRYIEGDASANQSVTDRETPPKRDLPHRRMSPVLVDPNDTLLEAAEDAGSQWPFACRGGACANCAVAVVDGEVPSPASHILPRNSPEGVRLSCIAPGV